MLLRSEINVLTFTNEKINNMEEHNKNNKNATQNLQYDDRANIKTFDTLINKISNTWILFCLKLTGCVWLKEKYSLQNAWNIFFIFNVLCWCVYYFVFATIDSVNTNGEYNLTVAYSFEETAICLSYLCILPTFYVGHVKLNNLIEFNVLEQIIPTKYPSRIWKLVSICFIINITSSIIIPAYELYLQHNNVYLIIHFILCMMLPINMFFILFDVELSKLCVEKLFTMIEQEDESIFEEYRIVELKVKIISNSSSLNTNFMLIVAIINIACIITITYMTTYANLYVLMSEIMVYIKEIIVLFIVFFETSKVNELSDKFVIDLTKKQFLNSTAEKKRMALYFYTQHHKIGYKLFGIRLKKWDIFIQSCSFVITFGIGIIKNIYLNV